jgi:hypothetical protein
VLWSVPGPLNKKKQIRRLRAVRSSRVRCESA